MSDLIAIPGLSPEDSPTTLTIVIIMHNAVEYSAKCLDSIRRHTTVDYRIHMLDNGSKDGTRDWLMGLPEGLVDRHVSDENLGAPGGRNYLLRRVPLGRYVVFLDNDCEVFEGWDRIILDGFETNRQIGAIGHAGWYLHVMPQNRVVIPPKGKGMIEVDVLTGYCMAMTREAVRACGLLDEGYGLYLFEDDDYCLRIKLAGYKVMSLPTIPVVHHTHRSSSTVPKILKLLYSLEKQRYFGKKWYKRTKLTRNYNALQAAPYYLREGLVGAKDLLKAQFVTWRNARTGTNTAPVLTKRIPQEETTSERRASEKPLS
jgi:GT2 family glycosyltransferase